MQKRRTRGRRQDVRKANVSNHGGGPPVGYGIADEESHMWSEPLYRKHPTTGYLEAVDEGLFFRMWPRHVAKLRQMKADGWAHVEIVRTARELWQAQQDQYADDQKLLDEHKEAKGQEQSAQVGDMRAGNIAPAPELPPGGPQAQTPPQSPEGDPFARAFSMDDEAAYRDRLEQFRGAHYSRDSIGPRNWQGTLMRGRQKPPTRERMEKVSSVLDHPDFSKGAKGAKGYPHSLPALPYGYDALEPILSEEAMRFHHKVHHKGYVDKLNELIKDTVYAPDSPQELLYRLNERLGQKINVQEIRDQCGGFLNHSLLWPSLSKDGVDPNEQGDLYKKVKGEFGSWSKMLAELRLAAQERFGAGWAWLAVPEDGGLAVYSTLNQDNPILWGDIPLLGIDVWEHSYYLDYGPNRKAYISSVMDLINWKTVEDRYEVAMSGNVLGQKSMGNGGGFQVYVAGEVEKADTTGGERLLTPEQRRKKREMTFTRKEQGVANASFNNPPEKNPNAPFVPKGP